MIESLSRTSQRFYAHYTACTRKMLNFVRNKLRHELFSITIKFYQKIWVADSGPTKRIHTIDWCLKCWALRCVNTGNRTCRFRFEKLKRSCKTRALQKKYPFRRFGLRRKWNIFCSEENKKWFLITGQQKRLNVEKTSDHAVFDVGLNG